MRDGRIRNKVALVTGSSSGIGEAIAVRFAKEGARVAVNCLTGLSRAKNVVSAIRRTGGEAIVIKADVSKADEVDRMVDAIMTKFGPIDILVNNAGIFLEKPLVQMTEVDWDRIIDVNLKGVYLCTQRVVREMLDAGTSGKIINISSMDAIVAELNASAYCASKGGVAAFTRALALELAPKKINVNAIAPGQIDTPLSAFEKDPTLLATLIENTPFRRIGKPEDVAAAALFLALDETEFINGITLVVDGGWTIT